VRPNELHPRSLIVPRSPAGLDAIERWDIEPDSELDVRALRREEVEHAFASGLFDSISERLGVRIDYFEHERIDPAQVKLALSIFEQWAAHDDGSHAEFYRDARTLLSRALASGMPVYVLVL